MTPELRTYALAASALALHLIAIALWTGAVRFQRKTWVNPEDQKLNGGTTAENDHPDTSRVKRAHLNALENAVPFFVVGALYAATSPGALAAQIYCGTFVAVRLLHTVFYLWGRQPFRTLSFGIGVLAVIGMAIHVIRFAL